MKDNLLSKYMISINSLHKVSVLALRDFECFLKCSGELKGNCFNFLDYTEDYMGITCYSVPISHEVLMFRLSPKRCQRML